MSSGSTAATLVYLFYVDLQYFRLVEMNSVLYVIWILLIDFLLELDKQLVYNLIVLYRFYLCLCEFESVILRICTRWMGIDLFFSYKYM